jgi:hypothetical protein
MAVLGDKAFSPFQVLAQQNPAQNLRVAQGLQAGRVAGMQQQVAQAPVAGPRAAQALGAQQAAQAGQINLQAQQQTVQQQQQIGQAALEAQRGQASLELGAKDLQRRKRADELTGKLYQLDKGLKNKLLDESIAFEKDEMGRTLFNERQLLDYKLQSAKSDVEFQKYEQQMQELSTRRMTMLKIAYQKVQQELSQAQEMTQQQLSQAQTKRLVEAKRALEEKMAREAARRKNRAAMIGAVGAVAGAVVGTLIAPGAGTVAGASLGGGVGTAAAAATE